MDEIFLRNRESGKVLVFGHRGYSELFPENTMVSFDACAKKPEVDGVELDVHVCKSGEVVIAHDFSLMRTAGVNKEIEELTLDELKTIDVGSFKGAQFSDVRVPLLEDLLGTYGNRFVYDIELKVKGGKINTELCRKTLDVIRKCNVQSSVMVSSFNPFALGKFGRISKHAMPTADIFSHAEDVPRSLRNGAGHFISHSSYLKPKYLQVDEAFFSSHWDLPVITWTVNTAEDVKRLIALNKGEKGMRVYGIIGNDPCLIAENIK
jgi:glycerophosphoryl diester phosphodiesterase